MANILEGIIKIEAQGVIQATKLVESSVKKIEGSLNSLNSKVASFGGGVRSFTSSFRGITPAFNEVRDSSRQATTAVLNFGRIVQDAPYAVLAGNISAIANNIDPFIESLRRTSKEAGGFTAGLKSMGKSLIGGAGIGLAISLVSSSLILFGDKLFGAGKKAKEADEELQKLAANFADQAVKMTSLVAVVTNVNSSYLDKKRALKELNSEYGPYLKNLGIEEISTKNITTAYDKLIDTLLRQAVVKGLQDQISKAVEERAKQVIKLQLAEQGQTATAIQQSKEQIDANKKVLDSVAKTGPVLNKAGQQLQGFSEAQRDGIQATIGRQVAIDGAIKSDNTYEKILGRLKNELKAQLAPLFGIIQSFDDLGISSGDAAEKVKKVTDEIKELNLNKVENIFPVEPIDDFITKVREANAEIRKFEGTGLEGTKVSLPGFITQALDKQNKEIKKVQELQESYLKLGDSISGIVSPAFQGMFNAIENGTNALEGFLQGLSGALKKIVEQLIATAAVAGIISLISGGAGAKGGLSFLGAFKKLLGGTSAVGGGGGGAIAAIGAGGGEFTMRLRGNDLIGSVSLTQIIQGRNG